MKHRPNPGECRHCGNRVRWLRPRRLCQEHYADPAVRARYPVARDPRPWTAADLDALARLHRAGLTARELAERLGRTLPAVLGKALRVGLVRCRQDKRRRRKVVRLARAGLTDPQIAAKLRCAPSTVHYHRRRAGLPALSPSQSGRAGNAAALARFGVHPCNLRWAEERAESERLGWPAGAVANDVLVLDALRPGPKTSAELAALVGRRPRTARERLQRMRRRGWVELAGRWGSHAVRWRIAPAVEEARRAKVGILSAAEQAELLARHENAFWHIAHKSCRVNKARLLEDVVGDVRLMAVRAARLYDPFKPNPRFPGKPMTFLTYFSRFAGYKAGECVKKVLARRERQFNLSEGAEGDVGDFEERMIVDHRGAPASFGPDWWGAALVTLDRRSRKVVEWRFRDGLGLREVAEMLGCSRERVRQIQDEAVARLRKTRPDLDEETGAA